MPMSVHPFHRLRSVLTKSITYQIISALAYLHHPRRGIAHRDIKPRNILLTAKGVVQMIDFGIAWESKGDRKQTEGKDATKDDLWPETEEQMYFEVATG